MIYIHTAANPDYRNECIEDTRILFYIPSIGYFGSSFKDSGKCNLITLDNDMPAYEAVAYNAFYGIKELIEHWKDIPFQKQQNLYWASLILDKAYFKLEHKHSILINVQEYILKCIFDYQKAISCLYEGKRVFARIKHSPVYKP